MSPLPSVHKDELILDGQHQYLALEAVVKSLAALGVKAPQWAEMLRCKRIKGDTPYHIRQTIAGREQARTASMSMSMEATVTLLLRDYEQEEGCNSLGLPGGATPQGCLDRGLEGNWNDPVKQWNAVFECMNIIQGIQKEMFLEEGPYFICGLKGHEEK